MALKGFIASLRAYAHEVAVAKLNGRALAPNVAKPEPPKYTGPDGKGHEFYPGNRAQRRAAARFEHRVFGVPFGGALTIINDSFPGRKPRRKKHRHSQ
jgi:hypothetical protein